MYCTLIPEAFSFLLAFSKNAKNERTMLFATIEEKPKIYMLNLHDITIKTIGRVIED
ncbi:hypothetical protein JOC37_000228 [Desulfohalotomaculum tongense]|uniref:hypothetical protein n=1 Tax=Desulforadius tongensis TaxID=1216062 RepID=UPI00195C0FE6|nr:hypothetical protein [Desulforadius tongensis]MBM7853863.1 hypothetical protein [Desulforadius tongensis]